MVVEVIDALKEDGDAKKDGFCFCIIFFACRWQVVASRQCRRLSARSGRSIPELSIFFFFALDSTPYAVLDLGCTNDDGDFPVELTRQRRLHGL